MKLLTAALSAIMIGSVLSASAQTGPAPARDMQSWNDIQLRLPLVKEEKTGKPKTSLMFYGTFRLGRNIGSFVDERAGLGVEFKLNKMFTVTPAILFREAQPWPGRKESERRLRVDVGIEKPFSRVVIRDRNRLEYRMRSGTANSARYRNRFQINVPVNKDGKELFTPFIADEVFYDFREERFTRNEFTMGVGRKISPRASVDLYYAYQRNRTRSFKVVNVFGLNWRFDVE